MKQAVTLPRWATPLGSTVAGPSLVGTLALTDCERPSNSTRLSPRFIRRRRCLTAPM